MSRYLRDKQYAGRERFFGEPFETFLACRRSKGFLLTLYIREVLETDLKNGLSIKHHEKGFVLPAHSPKKLTLVMSRYCSVYIKQYAVYINLHLFNSVVNHFERFEDVFDWKVILFPLSSMPSKDWSFGAENGITYY
jgi:hypothetical protein